MLLSGLKRDTEIHALSYGLASLTIAALINIQQPY